MPKAGKTRSAGIPARSRNTASAQKKRRLRFKWQYAAIPISLGIAAAALFALPLLNKPALVLTPSPTDSVIPTQEIKIVTEYDIGQYDVYWPESMQYPPLSECFTYERGKSYSDALSAAKSDPENVDAEFAVWICLSIIDDVRVSEMAGLDAFKYEGLAIAEWEEQARAVKNSREDWKRKKWTETYGAENASWNYDKWSGGEEEENWNIEFQTVWETEHPGSLYPIDGYESACDEYQKDVAQAYTEFQAGLIETLHNKGFDLSEVENEPLLYEAILSGEQLRYLPFIDGILAYTILFADEKNCSFNGNYIGSTMMPMTVSEWVAKMNDTEKATVTVLLKLNSSWDEVMAAFKEAYPEEYQVMVIEDARGDTPCPNPKEVNKAAAIREEFMNDYYLRVLNRFKEKYKVSHEDYIMGSGGNYVEAPWCVMKADKETILALFEDEDVVSVQLPEPLQNQ